MELIQSEFEDLAIKRNNLLLFTAENAIKVIKKCEELGIFIYGIDAFRLLGKYIQPLQEHSIDYSNVSNNNWKFATEFIQKKSNMGLVFEVVYDGYECLK